MPGRLLCLASPRGLRLALELSLLLILTVHCAPLSSTPGYQLASYNRGAQRFPVPTSPFTPYRKRIALLVGVDEYQHEELQPLKYAVKDAEDLGRMLTANFGFEVQVLKNAEATKEGLINAVIRLKDQTSFDDQLLFFFAGHGVSFGTKEQEIGYVLPSGALGRTQNLAWSSGIPMNELIGHLTKLPPKHLLILLDTCFGGYAAMRPRSAPSADPRRLLEQLTSRPGRHLITSGKRGQEVWESDTWGHSAFGAELLMALGSYRADRNADGLVPVSELYSYLEAAVTRRSGGAQTPHYAALDDNQGSFVFIRQRRRPQHEGNQSPPRVFPPALTAASIQNKAIISRHDARLFVAASGADGKVVALNQIFFMLEAKHWDRQPVTYGPTKVIPDGWLERSSFIEWPTILMIGPQGSSRSEPAPIFAESDCAEKFALVGKSGPCQELAQRPQGVESRLPGEEPLVPILEQTAHAYRGSIVLTSTASGVPELVLGWLPKSSRQKVATRELLFLPKATVRTLANLMEAVALAAQDGVSGGSDSFVLNLAPSLAMQLRISSDEILRPGESLEHLIVTNERLPFMLPLFTFTVEQVDEWSAPEFDRLSRVINDKVTALRDFANDPGTTHMFGETPHAFVPRELLP